MDWKSVTIFDKKFQKVVDLNSKISYNLNKSVMKLAKCVSVFFNYYFSRIFQMTKLFKVGGVSKSKSGYKVRFATDTTRVKILAKTDTDIQLFELPSGMTKPQLVTHLKTTELYANTMYKEAIDNADAKYNAVATVKITKAKSATPSLAALKARAEAAQIAELAE